MIKSVYGRIKELVRLVPVLDPTGRHVHKLTGAVVKFAQKIEFQVRVLITDNSRINQNMFKIFRTESQNFFENTDFPNNFFFFAVW